MRIVAGTLRGKTIDAPDGDVTRPTTDRVREALFSSLYSLQGGFEGAVVLDAFAGSGALGLEALSRGADIAVFYECDAKAASVLQRNIESCRQDRSRAQVVRRDIMKTPPDDVDRAFDLVFLDPPYDYDAVKVVSMLSRLAHGGALAQGAVVVYEHALSSSSDVEKALLDAGFEINRFKKYGKTGTTTALWNA